MADHMHSQQIAGLTYYVREDEIHVFRFGDSRRETVDAWARISRANDIAYAERGEHLRTIFDIGEEWFTPYSLSIIVKMVHTTPKELLESVAVVAGRNTMLGMVRSIIAKMPQNTDQVLTIFTTEADAIRWLEYRNTQLGK